jgi:transcriptional regulator GlxA family with amidase domain
MRRLTIAFILSPYFTLNPFAAMVDLLRLAADTGDRSRPIRCRWEVLGKGNEAIKASCGIEVTATAPLSNPEQYDYVAVVGGVLHKNASLSDDAQQFVLKAAAAGVPLIGLCTGIFHLIELGLLDGRRVCVSWFHIADLLERFPNVQPVGDALYVIDGDRISCAGGPGAAHLGAELVKKYGYAREAIKALHIMLLDEVSERSALQPVTAPFPIPQNPRIRRALLLMEQSMATPLSVENIARGLNVSRRQLERDFQVEYGFSPGQASVRLRLAHAKALIEGRDMAMIDIAAQCGFADSAHFSRKFRQVFACSPSEWKSSLSVA